MHSETGSYVPAAKDGFALLPVLEAIFLKLRLRYRSDATAAIAAVEQGFSKQAAYLKDTRQFRVNLAFLKETIAKYLEKLPSSFMTADPMTKPLPALEFHYHKNFSLMIQKRGNNRCKCLCKNVTGPLCADFVRCLSQCDEEYCEYCAETCRCPCFGGHEYRHTKKLLSESEKWVQNIEEFVMRRRRRRSRKAFKSRGRRAGAAHFGRSYSSDEDGDGPPEKRRVVDPAGAGAEAAAPGAPVVPKPKPPAPAPGAPDVPKPKPPAPPVVHHLPDQDNDADQDAFNAELEAINARMQNLALDRVRARVKQRAAPKARNEDRPKCGYPNLTPPHRPCRRSKAAGLKYCSEHCAIFLENGGDENDLRL